MPEFHIVTYTYDLAYKLLIWHVEITYGITDLVE